MNSSSFTTMLVARMWRVGVSLLPHAHRLLSTMPRPPAAAMATNTAQNTAQIVEIKSPQEFEQLAVVASAQPPPVGGPVILDFYADWCGPCKQLTPKLEKLVTASQGAVRLAKINVDNLPEIAQALQVKSLPTVMLLHAGKLVDQFTGVLPDAQIKQFVDKAAALVGGAGVGPRALEEAATLLEGGDVPGATRAYAQLLALPEHAASARAGLALCALRDTPPNLALAQDLVAELHKNYASSLNNPEVRKAISTVALAAEAGDAAASGGPTEAEMRAILESAPRDHATRYALAQKLLGAGQHDESIEELLLVLRKGGKAWNEGAAKGLLLKIFDMLGTTDERAVNGRRRMNSYILM